MHAQKTHQNPVQNLETKGRTAKECPIQCGFISKSAAINTSQVVD
jgi:hypothetical protein